MTIQCLYKSPIKKKKKKCFRYINTFYTSGSFASCISTLDLLPHTNKFSFPLQQLCHFSLSHEGRSPFHPFIPLSFLSQPCLLRVAHSVPPATSPAYRSDWMGHSQITISKVKIPKQQNFASSAKQYIQFQVWQLSLCICFPL